MMKKSISTILILIIVLISNANAATDRVIVSAHIEGKPKFYPRSGDLWMSTWADDNNLYLTWGDGTARGDCCPAPDIENPPPCKVIDPPIFWDEGSKVDCSNHCSCLFTDAGVGVFKEPVMSDSDCQQDCIQSYHIPRSIPSFDSYGNVLDRDDKPSSILFLDGTLYLAGHSALYSDTEEEPMLDPENGYIAYSKDYGKTWIEVANSPWQRPSPFRVLMFINMGKNYSLNKDGYVYLLGIGSEAAWKGPVYLARVPKKKVIDYKAYRYFSGLNPQGNPTWTDNQYNAKSLKELRSKGLGSAMYHKGTERYLFLTTDHREDPTTGNRSGALFSAPHAWGPWRKVSDLFNEANYPSGWPKGAYIPGVITKDTGPDYFYFTVSFFGEVAGYYQLTIGKIKLKLVPAVSDLKITDTDTSSATLERT